MTKFAKAALVAAAVGAAVVAGALAQKPAPCFTRDARAVRSNVPACAVTGECAVKNAPVECGPDAGVMPGLP